MLIDIGACLFLELESKNPSPPSYVKASYVKEFGTVTFSAD